MTRASVHDRGVTDRQPRLRLSSVRVLLVQGKGDGSQHLQLVTQPCSLRRHHFVRPCQLFERCATAVLRNISFYASLPVRIGGARGLGLRFSAWSETKTDIPPATPIPITTTAISDTTVYDILWLPRAQASFQGLRPLEAPQRH